MVTAGGPEDLKADRWLAAFAADGFPDGWRSQVQGTTPADDPSALVVRHEAEGLVYATVFGELIEAVPGRLRLEYSRRPWTELPWTRVVLTGAGERAGPARPRRARPAFPPSSRGPRRRR
jgi:hypothetical protein